MSNQVGTISGKVTDSLTGNSISGAAITTNPATQTVTTDASGNYTISNVPVGTYTVTAAKTDYNTNSQSNVTVTANQTTTVNITLNNQVGTISGKVTDSSTGIGISGATITTNPATQTITTDTSGNYTISNVPVGIYTVTAAKTDYNTNSQSNVAVTANQTTTVNLTLTLMGTSCPSTVTYGGKIYNTVQISSQCWFKENLNAGIKINSNSGSDNQINNGIIEKYCYNNDEANCTTYGGLYQWNEAMGYSTVEGSQGICPDGWHIPTYAELQTLSNAVGGSGNALKAVGQGSGSGTGTNTSGFSALLAGSRYSSNGNFYSLGYYTYFWSSTEYSSSNAYYLSLHYYTGDVYFNNYIRITGLVFAA